ncbi:hypothetical protein [Glycomyces terrestris]|uniref:Carboxypeptidase regulatory-like domain-containing protein n=1 Tax=Glycomyces terrestris TaxID=2493553 RepID=A0A426V426_9ACTN|nr:hypothetical protein [Glycomyces terrestris]RRS01669.1 hypothetical protein EIW28_02595 [Glycomyces terrestris]
MKLLGALALLALVPAAAACGVATPTLAPADPATDAAEVGPAAPAESEQETGTLVVAVTDDAGTPLEGVPLELTALDIDNTVPDWESAPLTGPDGTIEITGLLGEYQVATVRDGTNDLGTVVVEPGAAARLDLVLAS